MRILMLLAAALASAPLAAQTRPSSADPNERICRTTGQIGSRLGARRVCKTQAEWDEIQRANRAGVNELQTRLVNPTVDRFPGVPNGMAGTPR